MKKNGTFDYFDQFALCVTKAQEAAAALSAAVAMEAAGRGQALDALHCTEQEADALRRQALDRLAREFLPPVEREDIVTLYNTLDDVVDDIEEVLRRMCLYRVGEALPAAAEFAALVERCCEALGKLAAELPHFRRSQALFPAIEAVSKLEEDGDALHFKAVRELFTAQAVDPLTVIAWKEVLDALETCCDDCEHVADAVESVVLKNT